MTDLGPARGGAMKFAILFILMGFGWIAVAVVHGGPAWLLAWPGVAFLVVGAGYAGLGSRVTGKRRDGTIPWWSIVLLLPYLGLTWAVWFLHGLVARPRRHDEVAPGLWIGRRTGAGQLPDRVGLVVDLTCEFQERKDVRVRDGGGGFLCLPTLEYHVPDVDAFRELVRQVARTEGGVYIHCAQGYGRSAMLAAAVLIERGLAADLDEAERILKRSRPRVRLGPRQRELVRRAMRLHGDRGGSESPP